MEKVVRFLHSYVNLLLQEKDEHIGAQIREKQGEIELLLRSYSCGLKLQFQTRVGGVVSNGALLGSRVLIPFFQLGIDFGFLLDCNTVFDQRHTCTYIDALHAS